MGMPHKCAHEWFSSLRISWCPSGSMNSGAVLPGGMVRADTLKMNFIFKMADAILTLHAAEAH